MDAPPPQGGQNGRAKPSRLPHRPLLVARVGAEVWVKHENHTPTGAFKLRGGLIHVGRLAREGMAPNGIISATRGNHGQSLAYAGRHFGVPVTIVVPHGNSLEKNAAMRALGTRLLEHGADFDVARVEAARLAEEEGLRFAPSFHPDLVLGGRDMGPGAVSGRPAPRCALCADRLGLGHMRRDPGSRPAAARTEIIGVQSAHAPAYAHSVAEGRIVHLETADTQADGLAVRIPDPDALAIITQGASRIVTVTDDEVAEAIRAYSTDTHNPRRAPAPPCSGRCWRSGISRPGAGSGQCCPSNETCARVA